VFTIQFAPGVCLGYSSAIAQAATLRQAVDFAAAFAPNGFGVIASSWVERGGQRLVEVYDWCDCWFADPPVLAWIIASEAASQ